MSRGRFVSGGTVTTYVLPSFETPAGRALPRPLSPEEERAEAFRTGFLAGEKAGADNVEMKAALLLEGMETAVAALNAERARLAEALRPQVFDLAVAVARRIVIEELALSPGILAGIVKEAVRRVERSGPVTIRVHPDLYGLFLKLRPDLAEVHPEILLESDASVAVNGPVVIGATEEVATDIDEQIRNVVEDIRGELVVD